MVATVEDIVLLSCCGFAGNIGAAVTGFGQAIIYLFVWQIVELAGYSGDFKYAVFVQSLSLFSMQPLLLYKANVVGNAYRRILLLFVPITLITTPLGQLLSDSVPTAIVQAVAGALVTFVACFELYRKRKWFMSVCQRENNSHDGGAMETSAADEANEEKEEKCDVGEDNVAENCGEADPEDKPNDIESTNNNSGAQANQLSINEQAADELRIGLNKATFWTLIAGGASGFLGGMVAIRGPPLIFYFLHPPKPVTFNKSSQRATGVVIMFL
ncbi:hypothetical protein THAOC_14314 [Thalassiosira oceanica]|uniref:Uncharacterized protein n=1 Tax=Thalassiosira oceanica TaxID=159749 RepID=K0SFH9_THAOC|nr:hypothetical protein THAOC_14314 [Thalassiosira oceanica]|eukprot:EJK64898.1 hypothetical protein THAOC_14314 [Thalassiosira oceanica]